VEDNKFLDLATDIAKLVNEKDKAYGSAFELSGKIVEILFPNGVKPSQYSNLLAITRVIDKLVRIANTDDIDPMGEDPWMDILGYGLLATFVNRKNRRDTMAELTQLDEEGGDE